MLKRMTTVTVALLLALPALASAKEMTGRLGLGYNNSDAPLGVRYWFNPKAGVDLGFGFDSTDLGTKNATDYFFEVGVPYVVYGGEHANLFVRLGAQVGAHGDHNLSSTVSDKSTSVLVELGPGAEVFLGDNFSLQASHGIVVKYTKLDQVAPGEEDTFTDYSSFANSVTELGFHYYF